WRIWRWIRTGRRRTRRRWSGRRRARRRGTRWWGIWRRSRWRWRSRRGNRAEWRTGQVDDRVGAVTWRRAGRNSGSARGGTRGDGWCWRRRKLRGSRRRSAVDDRIVRATGKIAERSREPHGHGDVPVALDGDAGARAIHPATSAGGAGGAGAFGRAGQTDVAEVGGTRGDPVRAGQLRARGIARKCGEATAGPDELGDRSAAENPGSAGRSDGQCGDFGAVVHGIAGPGILATGAGREQEGSADVG